jgi:cysteine desulfuration protein SufE
MNVNIKEITEQIQEDFSYLDDWDNKYEYLIELGKSLPLIPAELKTDENKVSGCQSQVWVKPEMKDGLIYFKADSDAIITKGLISLLVKVFSGQKPEDIATADLSFLDKIGMKEHLSPTRANGLMNMVKRLKEEALKYINN